MSARRVNVLVASERAEVVALLEWLARSRPPAGCFVTTIPGGDGRETRAPGYVAGTPDILAIYAGRPILVEMKRRRGGSLSEAQKAAHRHITMAGGLVLVAYGWQHAATQLAMLIPFRTRIAVAA